MRDFQLFTACVWSWPPGPPLVPGVFSHIFSVSLSDEETGSAGRKALKCKNPTVTFLFIFAVLLKYIQRQAYLGQVVKKDCSLLFCTKLGKAAVWQETFDSTACCSFQRFGFKIGQNISSTMQDGSAVNLMCVRRYDGQADIVMKLNDGFSGLINRTVAEQVDRKLEDSMNLLSAKWNQTLQTRNAKLRAEFNQTNTILMDSLSSLKVKLDNNKVELDSNKVKLDNHKGELDNYKVELDKYKQMLQNMPGKWSPGSYCFLANGSCPKGFTRHDGHLRAISMYAASTSYLKEEKFGDSKISCHGTCGQYPKNYGEIFIVTCCK